MLKPISNPKSVVACLADCPQDNPARQLALFLYGTLLQMFHKTYKTDEKQISPRQALATFCSIVRKKKSQLF